MVLPHYQAANSVWIGRQNILEQRDADIHSGMEWDRNR